MPFFNYKCSECEFMDEFMVGGCKGSPEPTTCPECSATDTMEKQFSMGGISGEVVGGYEYEYGKKSWHKNASSIHKAAILAGDCDPY